MAPTQRWTGLTLLLLVGLLHALLLAWLAFHVAEPWVPWLSCAADVALTTSFGRMELKKFVVISDEVMTA